MAEDLPYKDVRKLLLASIRKRNAIGKGSETRVFQFDEAAGEALRPFVIRVYFAAGEKTPRQIRKSLKSLDETTCLTPVDPLVGKIHVGQPLLSLLTGHGEQIDIMVRQPGRSLEEWQDELQKKHRSRLDVGIELLGMALASEPRKGAENPFLPVFDDAYRLAYRNIETDTDSYVSNGGNIVLDKDGRLGLVDQTNHDVSAELVRTLDAPSRHAKAKVALRRLYGALMEQVPFTREVNAEIIGASHPLPREQLELYETRRDTFKSLLDDAQATIEARYREHRPSSPSFRKVAKTEAVALSDPPQRLVQKLQKLQRQHGIPERV